MIRWFRRRRPSPPTTPQLTVAETLIIHRAGLTLTQWTSLTNKERADIRWRVGA